MHHHCIAMLRTVRCATASPRAIVTTFLPSTLLENHILS